MVDRVIFLGMRAKDALAVWLSLQQTRDDFPAWDRVAVVLGSRKVCTLDPGIRERGAGQVTIDEFRAVQRGLQKRGILQRATGEIVIAQERVVQNCSVQVLPGKLGNCSGKDGSTAAVFNSHLIPNY